MLKPGDAAPDFSAQDHTGKTVKLSDFKGKNLVLWFFPKADTPG
jgi:peroxiredoxin Q/BCP